MPRLSSTSLLVAFCAIILVGDAGAFVPTNFVSSSVGQSSSTRSWMSTPNNFGGVLDDYKTYENQFRHPYPPGRQNKPTADKHRVFDTYEYPSPPSGAAEEEEGATSNYSRPLTADEQKFLQQQEPRRAFVHQRMEENRLAALEREKN